MQAVWSLLLLWAPGVNLRGLLSYVGVAMWVFYFATAREFSNGRPQAPAISPRGLTPTVAANSGAGGAATDGADVAPALSGAAALRCHLYGVSGVADRLDARAAAAADAGGAWPGFFGLAHTMGMAKVGARGAVTAADGGCGRMKTPARILISA